MALFKDKIELSMKDSRSHLIEKYVFDVRKGTVEIKVAPGYRAIINGSVVLSPNQTASFSKKMVGDSITAFIYQDQANLRPLSVPFVAGQHTISLDAHKTAKVRFAVVGTAKIEIVDYKDLAAYFDNTLTYDDIDKALIETFRPALSAQMAAAAKAHISSASTDVSIAADLRNIAADGVRNSSLRATLNSMGLTMTSAGISLWLNPIGDSAEIIEKINARFNEAAMEEFDDAKVQRKREWDKEDKLIDQKHEIDVINAQHTDTKNNNQSNTYNYNGGVPNTEVHYHGKGKGAANQKRFCPVCGQRIEGDAAFCPRCGNKLD